MFVSIFSVNNQSITRDNHNIEVEVCSTALSCKSNSQSIKVVIMNSLTIKVVTVRERTSYRGNKLWKGYRGEYPCALRFVSGYNKQCKSHSTRQGTSLDLNLQGIRDPFSCA